MRLGIDVRKAWDGGIGRYIRNLVEGLLPLGVVQKIHLWHRPGDPFLKGEHNKVVRHVEKAVPYRFFEQVSLRRKINEADLDLFFSPHYVVPIGLKMPLAVMIHDVIHLVFPKSLFHRGYALTQMGHAIRTARVILTPSEFSRREILRFFPQASGKIYAIPHGLEASFSGGPIEGEEGIVRRLKLPERYLFYVGNHKSHKNLFQLLEICQKLFERFSDLYLCLTGDETEEGGNLLREIRRRGIQERVRFLGTLDNEALRVGYRNALCFVFPSLYEGFGFPPLEAMACGTPVVAFRVASLPEVVGEGGLLVRRGDSKEFYEAVRMMVEREEFRREWGERGKQKAAEFRWEASIAKHIEIFQRVLS